MAISGCICFSMTIECRNMKRLPVQAVLPFGRKEKVINRQLRERMAGKKVRRGPGRPELKNGRVSHQKRAVLGEKRTNFTLKKRRAVVRASGWNRERCTGKKCEPESGAAHYSN